MSKKIKKSKKSKVSELFEAPPEKQLSAKQQKKLDKREQEQDKKFNKEFEKNLIKMNLIEIDRSDSSNTDWPRVSKMLLEGTASWHHYSMGKHYYQVNKKQE